MKIKVKFTIRQIIIFTMLSTLLISIVALFTIKYNVRQKIKILHKININIKELQENIHVLKAEYTYLTRPKNIKEIAEEKLNLRHIKKSDLMKLEE